MTGVVIVVPPVTSSSPAGCGKVRCIFFNAAAATHPTRWRVDGGPWFNVGDPAMPYAIGPHTLSFDAVLGTDTNPPNQIVIVVANTLHQFKINYT